MLGCVWSCMAVFGHARIPRCANVSASLASILALCLCLSFCLFIWLTVSHSLSTFVFPYLPEAIFLREADQPETSERVLLKSGLHMTLHADVCEQKHMLTWQKFSVWCGAARCWRRTAVWCAAGQCVATVVV